MAGHIPEIYQMKLPRGIHLLGVEYTRVPWVSLTLMVKRGAETDPPGQAGVADWTADFLTLGTARRTQRQLAEDVESLGAHLMARADYDATYVSLGGLAEDFTALMDTLAEVVQTPGFPEEEFPLLKERRRAELAQVLDDPREVANRWFRKLFFGTAPYGQAVRGEPETLDALTLADLKDHYSREFAPEVATLVVVGALPRDRVEEEARRLWEVWAGGGPVSPAYTAPPPQVTPPGLYLLDRPELTQSEIRMGHLGLPRHHPDFFPLRLANYILGEGGFSSRLMSRIRSDLGLTYGIRSHFHFRRAPSPLPPSPRQPTPPRWSRRSRRWCGKYSKTGWRPRSLPRPRATTWATFLWVWKPLEPSPASCWPWTSMTWGWIICRAIVKKSRESPWKPPNKRFAPIFSPTPW